MIEIQAEPGRWYYAFWDGPELTGDYIGYTSAIIVDGPVYRADGYLEDRHVKPLLPETLANDARLIEEMEASFLFQGTEAEFKVLMHSHGIHPLPPGGWLYRHKYVRVT